MGNDGRQVRGWTKGMRWRRYETDGGEKKTWKQGRETDGGRGDVVRWRDRRRRGEDGEGESDASVAGSRS